MTLTAKTGTCVVTGMGAMTDVDVKLNLFLFTMLPKTLKGNIFGGDSSHVATPKLVGLYKSGLLKIGEMVTRLTRWTTSTTAPRTCSTARTSAALSSPTNRTGNRGRGKLPTSERQLSSFFCAFVAHRRAHMGHSPRRSSTVSISAPNVRSCVVEIPSNTIARTNSA